MSTERAAVWLFAARRLMKHAPHLPSVLSSAPQQQSGDEATGSPVRCVLPLDAIQGLERVSACVYADGSVRLLGPDILPVHVPVAEVGANESAVAAAVADRWARAADASAPVAFPFAGGVSALACSSEALLVLGNDGRVCLWDVAKFLNAKFFPSTSPESTANGAADGTDASARANSTTGTVGSADSGAVSISISSTGVSVLRTGLCQSALDAARIDAERRRVVDDIQLGCDLGHLLHFNLAHFGAVC